MKNIYPDLYSKDKLLVLTKKHPRANKMLSLISKLNLKNKSILDIGCHDGTFLSNLKSRTTKLFGVDANPTVIKLCPKNKVKAKLYFFDDKTPIPFPDKSFNLIVCGEIIEHIYDTDMFLNEIHRLLKSKGHLLISTPNIASLGRRILLCLGISPLLEDSPSRNNSVGHIRYFTHKTLQKILIENKFKIQEITSDIVNFDNTGQFKSKILINIFPSIGQSVIILCQKI